jgi:hypothetical protein
VTIVRQPCNNFETRKPTCQTGGGQKKHLADIGCPLNPGKDGGTGRVACDNYHRYPEENEDPWPRLPPGLPGKFNSTPLNVPRRRLKSFLPIVKQAVLVKLGAWGKQL